MKSTQPTSDAPRHSGPVRPVRIDRGDPMSVLIARLMDTVFIIPGTGIRFGFDALIGLFPGIGDSVGALISTVLVAQAARQGVPKIVIARMVGNVLINSFVGAIPVFGDVFSVFFRSNVRNLDLLQRHSGRARSAGPRDWIFVGGLILGMLAVLAVLIVGLIVAARALVPEAR